MLAIARALMSEPNHLLLDETFPSLAPMLVSGIFKMIQGLNEKGLTILLVEQNAQKASPLQILPMSLKRVEWFRKSGKEIAEDPIVKKAYLGIESDAC